MISDKTFTQRITDVQSWSVFALIISICSLILSITAIATRYPRTEMDFDYLGFMLGVLAFITTLVIGYQIAAAFISREQIREMDVKIHHTLHTNLYHVFIIQGKYEEDRDHFESALNYYFKGLECASKAELRHEIRQVVSTIKQILENGIEFHINKSDSNSYCGIIGSIEHEDKDDIMVKIKNIVSDEAPSLANSWGTTYITSHQP